MTTAFYWDEQCFWHIGEGYALTYPLGGHVQPLSAGGLPESPEAKRRLKSLIDVTGLGRELEYRHARPASRNELELVHPAAFLDAFKEMSDDGGGELGLRTPFGKGGYETAALSAGLARAALFAVLNGEYDNAYALTRPPGHHCLPDWPNGFCLLANIAIAVEAAMTEGLASRVAVLDWDVHHGNGTEAIFYDRDDVLTISIHQENNYPTDTGDFQDRGAGAGEGFNLNIPLPGGTGHKGYLEAMERLVLPSLADFQPDVIIVASGYDASIYDPLGRMMAVPDTFRQMTAMVMGAADTLCDGKLVVVHEGGYSDVHVPFCGHAVVETLAGSSIRAVDPMEEVTNKRQPGPEFDAFLSQWIDGLCKALD